MLAGLVSQQHVVKNIISYVLGTCLLGWSVKNMLSLLLFHMFQEHVSRTGQSATCCHYNYFINFRNMFARLVSQQHVVIIISHVSGTC